MSISTVRDFINRQQASATGLAALAAALDARVSQTPLEPGLDTAIGELLRALDAPDPASFGAPEAAAALAEIRFSLAMDVHLTYAHSRATRWSYVDPALLQAIGNFARMHGLGLIRNAASLGDLRARLDAPGAAILDVGVGVAGTAIALAEALPNARVVGLDVWAPALALARENVRRAGLGERIEIREQGAETLDEHGVYDLAWIPPPFIPEHLMPAVIARAREALRPGGWLVLACFADFGTWPPAAAALWKLRVATWGGVLWSTQTGAAMLAEHGLGDILTLPSPPGVPAQWVAGRRT